AAAARVAGATCPRWSTPASAEYRSRLATVLTRRALLAAAGCPSNLVASGPRRSPPRPGRVSRVGGANPGESGGRPGTGAPAAGGPASGPHHAGWVIVRRVAGAANRASHRLGGGAGRLPCWSRAGRGQPAHRSRRKGRAHAEPG